MNLGHPFLIYDLCKKSGVPLESNETWIHPIKAIVIKKNKSGVPRIEEVYDSRNEPTDEEEIKAYQTMFRMRDEDRREAGQSSTQPPPPLAHDEDNLSSPHSIEDQVQVLTMRFDTFWDETQEHHVSMGQEMDELKRQMKTMLDNQEIIKQHLAQILSYHTPPPPSQ